MFLHSIVRYADDTAGLEKLLRLLQGFCTIAAGLPSFANDVETVLKLRAQFALARRYFRFLKWHPCWSNALQVFGKNHSPLIMLIEFGKWSFLGIYFFLEMLTIGNALGVTASEWQTKLQLEANKCWFYALVSSTLFGLWEIFLEDPRGKSLKATPAVDGIADGNDTAATKLKKKPPKQTSAMNSVNRRVYTQLVVDTCDLFIPGSAVGWIPVGPVVVGTASTISSVLAGQQIWKRVQQRASQ